MASESDDLQEPSACMLGMGWFPDQVGGLDRYYRGLFEALPRDSTSGLVIGPAADAPANLTAVSDHSRPLWLRLLLYARAARRLISDAALIDAHFALYAVIPFLRGPFDRRPRVVHFQGPWAEENVAQGDRSSFRYQVRRMLEMIVYRRADRVIVLSHAFKRIAVERYRVSPWKVEVIAPGVDQSLFTPGDRQDARSRLGIGNPAEAFVAVCVRRLVPRMGLDKLLWAWAEAVGSFPPGSRLLIAGDGPLREQIALQVETLGIADSVTMLGRVSDQDLVNLYRAADVGVVPTLVHEGFGLVVAEAASCGTPSIVTDAGGLPEAIGALDRSLIVPAGDAQALSDRLVRAAVDSDLPSRADTLGFAERFNWRRVATRHSELYQRLLQRRPDVRQKVVYVDHVAQLSGGEIALLRLLPHLKAINAHVILGEDGALADRLAWAGISCEVMPLHSSVGSLRKQDVAPRRVPLASVAYTISYTLRLGRYLRRISPDLVHTNSLKAGVYGCAAARIAGVPAIWHLRDRISADYLPAPAVMLIRRLIRRLPSAVIANSASTASTIARSSDTYIISSVIYDVPSDIGGSSPSASPATSGYSVFTVGIIGRVAPWKGQDIFLRAFAEAFPVGPERAVIIGSPMFGASESEFAESLHQLARELGIQERTEFRGFQEDVAAEMANLDVVVHASITPEPFGQVIIEAMSIGVPVVATSAGGPAEIIGDHESGLLYPPGDDQELARLMLRLRDEPNLRANLAHGGRLRAKEYRPEKIIAEIEAIYDQVLASS